MCCSDLFLKTAQYVRQCQWNCQLLWILSIPAQCTVYYVVIEYLELHTWISVLYSLTHSLLIVLLYYTVQEQQTESTHFCRLICNISEPAIFRRCVNIYVWCLADYQPRPSFWWHVQVSLLLLCLTLACTTTVEQLIILTAQTGRSNRCFNHIGPTCMHTCMYIYIDNKIHTHNI